MATYTFTNGLLTLGDSTIPADRVEIHIAQTGIAETRITQVRSTPPFHFSDASANATMSGIQGAGRAIDLMGRIMARNLLPFTGRFVADVQCMEKKLRQDLYWRGMIWADRDGRWRMDGYDEDLTWFRDLLAFRYGDAVGPVMRQPYPYFQIDLTQTQFMRGELSPNPPDPWAETDEACIRRWMHCAEHFPAEHFTGNN